MRDAQNEPRASLGDFLSALRDSWPGSLTSAYWERTLDDVIRVGLVLVALFAVSASGCIEPHCDLACPRELLQAKVDVTAAQLSGGSVTFCVNNLCHAGELPQVSASGITRVTLDACTGVELLPYDPGFDILLDPCDVTTVVAGDALALTLADSSSRVFLSRSVTVGYKDEDVCGTTCHVLQLEF